MDIFGILLRLGFVVVQLPRTVEVDHFQMKPIPIHMLQFVIQIDDPL